MSTTTHDRTLEQLAWFLNGTLEDAERREVEDHLASCADCRAELEATRRAFEVFAAHLPPQALTAFVLDPEASEWEVDGDRVERGVVVGHLAHCEDCREEVALLRESRSAELADAADERGGVLPFVPRRGAPAPRWLPLTLAASLLFTVIAAGGWLTARQQLDDRQRSVALLEERLEEAQAVLATARGSGTSTAEAAARDLQREVEELETELAEVSGRLEEESRRAERLALAQETTLPTGANPLVLERSLRPVERGEPVAAEGEAAAADPGTPLVFKIRDPEGRLEASDAARYRLVDPAGVAQATGELTVRPAQSAFEPASVAIAVDTSRLASGRFTLEILAGDDMVGRFPFVVP